MMVITLMVVVVPAGLLWLRLWLRLWRDVIFGGHEVNFVGDDNDRNVCHVTSFVHLEREDKHYKWRISLKMVSVKTFAAHQRFCKQTTTFNRAGALV